MCRLAKKSKRLSAGGVEYMLNLLEKHLNAAVAVCEYKLDQGDLNIGN